MSRAWTAPKSAYSPSGTASAMVCAGKSCSAMATSPKARSRSTRHTSRRPLSASAAAMLVASVVLPQPPLAEKTVMMRPRGPPGVPPPGAWSRMAAARPLVRRTASCRPEMLRSPTTSRTPARMASASSPVSTRERTRITPSAGRQIRNCSATRKAADWSTVGPSTTVSSAGSVSSRWRSASRLVTTWDSPTALLSAWAMTGLRSQIVVITALRGSRRRLNSCRPASRSCRAGRSTAQRSPRCWSARIPGSWLVRC